MVYIDNFYFMKQNPKHRDIKKTTQNYHSKEV